MLKYFVFLFAIFSQACLADLTVRLATYPGYEPFNFYKQGIDSSQYFERILSGKDSTLFTGLAWQVVLSSFQQQNYHVELYIVPWARAMNMLHQGQVDAIFPAIKTPERERKFLYSRRTLYPPNSILLYSRKGALPKDYLPALKDLRIGVVRGFSYGQRWPAITEGRNLSFFPLRSLKHGFIMLENNRIDTLPGYELSHDYYLTQWNKKHLFDKSQPFDTAHSYLMFKPDSINILEDFNAGQDKLVSNGRYQELLKIWHMPRVE